MKHSPTGVSLALPTTTRQDDSFPVLYWIGSSGAPASCLWPTARNDGSRAPSVGLREFRESVEHATARVLVLDAHFDGSTGMHVVAPWLNKTSAGDVRVLTGIEEDDIHGWMRDNRFSWTRSVRLKYRPGLRQKVHDRFALVDDELWHWGSTVGGGLLSLSAATRGWAAFAQEFAVLFNNIWDS